MKELFFDTETTGLPPSGAKYDTDFMSFPHIVQLSWYFDGQFKDFIIKPDGYEIPEEVSKIHGITTEIALEKGVLFENIITGFIDDCLLADKIIGHNIYFDISIVKANILRISGGVTEYFTGVIVPALDKSKRVCTMMKTIKFVGATFSGSNRLKFPNLSELYFKLFQDSFDAHNSLQDVMAVKRCYEELVRIGEI
jgi:DNA polymerase III epsilon subunit-like protein